MYSGMMEEIIIPIHKQMAQLNIGKSPFDPPEVMCEFEKKPSTPKPDIIHPHLSKPGKLPPSDQSKVVCKAVSLMWHMWVPHVTIFCHITSPSPSFIA